MRHGCQMAIARFLDRMCLALRASGLWLRYATLQNLIPSFPWIAPPRPPPWRNPRKGRDLILPSGNPVQTALPPSPAFSSPSSLLRIAEADGCNKVHSLSFCGPLARGYILYIVSSRQTSLLHVYYSKDCGGQRPLRSRSR